MPTDTMRDPKAYGSATKSTGPEIPDLEDDLYRAIVKDVKQTTGSFQGAAREQYVVEFELLDVKRADGNPMTMRSWIAIPPALMTDGTLNENSHLYEFLMALGYTDDNLEVNPAAWQGEELRINVENKEIKEGDNKGKTRPKVTGWKKPRGGAAAPAEEKAKPAAAAAEKPAQRSTRAATPARAAAAPDPDDDDF